MQPVLDALQSNAGLLAALAVVLGLIAVLIAWRAARRELTAPAEPEALRQPEPERRPLMASDPRLDQLLAAQAQRMDALTGDVRTLGARTRTMEQAGRAAIQHVGLVRFNPFREDTGGNLSFALALLDADENGIVLSSLHSRTTTRVYVKSITAGQPDQPMSEEETEALNQARGRSLLPAH
jgi:hypothetical protein